MEWSADPAYADDDVQTFLQRLDQYITSTAGLDAYDYRRTTLRREFEARLQGWFDRRVRALVAEAVAAHLADQHAETRPPE